MGPEGAKSFPGKQWLRVRSPEGEPLLPAARAKQAADYGRRGRGYVIGAVAPANGQAFTQPYEGRTAANGVEFLERVEQWIAPEVERVYAIVDNLSRSYSGCV